MDIQIQIEQAKRLHQQGHLSDASLIYEAVLKSDPFQSEAMHLLGLVAAQSGNYQLAVNWISKALIISPQNEKYHNNLGTSFFDWGQYIKAIESYDNAIELNTDYADAYFNKGLSLIQLKDWGPAAQSLQQALRHQPDFFEAYCLLGNTLQELNRFDEAISNYQTGISINPNYAPVFYNMGNAFKAKKQFEIAVENYDKCLVINPDFLDAYVNRGVALKELGQFESAIQSQDKALTINKECAQAFNNRGNALKELKRFEEAVADYEKAINLKPDFAEAYSNLGLAFWKLNRLEEAILNCDKAINIKEDYAIAHFNRGVLFTKLNRLEEAIANYEKAISIDEEYADAYYNKSLLLLLFGEFSKGWELYDWRWRLNKGGPQLRNFAQPLFKGTENLQDKNILIHSEQGLGDSLQFIRYVPLLAAQGAKVIVEVQAQLISLFQNINGISVLLKNGDPLPSFDLHCPMMSLPLAFNTDLSTIPSCPQFVIAVSKTQYWIDKLGSKVKLRVGLVWNGGFRPNQADTLEVNERRNLPLEQLKKLKDIDVEFISLQKGEPAESEFRQAVADGWDGPFIHDHVNELKDFSDTAALVMNLDLVIAVDTSTAHLAATLGKPVWLLNRYDTCWRWLLDREDSPWYPSIKIYRQPSWGDWDSVMQRVRSDLIEMVSKK